MKNEMVKAVTEALYFADTGEEGQPSRDAYISDELRGRIAAQVEEFVALVKANAEAFAAIEDYGPETTGHDLYFTSNRHGVGFWDGDWGVNGDFLSKCADKVGPLDIYEGDDGLIYAA